MSDQALRRTSYGPTSPTIGERGARTRSQILEAGLTCFVARGFHETSMENIAAAADTSRATLYQYFESKDAIFTELLYENGNILIRITGELGRLGSDKDGFRHLAAWVRAWTDNFDHFAPLFVEWTNVVAPNSPLRPQLLAFTNGFAKKIAKVLTASGQADHPPEAMAVLVIALLTRYNYIRYVYRPGLSDAELLDSILVGLQLLLFPDTSDEVLAGDPFNAGPPEARTPAPPVARMGPLSTLPRGKRVPPADPLHGLSRQATRTARTLLDAAEHVFAQNGYAAANIDQVVAHAGVARGTFYRYFTSKFDLIAALSDEAARAMVPMFEDLPTAVSDPDQLREWLAAYLSEQRRYTGVLRAWSEGAPIDPALLQPAAEVVVALGDAVAEIFGDTRPYPLARRAAGMLLSSLLEHFPNEGAGTDCEPTPEDIVELQAKFIERVLLRR